MMNNVGSNFTILVIDDEEIVRQSLCDQLEDMGYDVIGAEQGKIGVEKIKSEHPDLILTDMRMPEMSGLDVIKNSKIIAPDTPIIVISGAGRLDDAVEALRLGAYDYLIKPVRDFAVLEHAVNKALENKRLIEENRNYQVHLELQVKGRTQELIIANKKLSEHKDQLEEEVKLQTKEIQESLERLTKTQDHLIESEKMASLGSLVAGVAHELNTPIGICVTAISFLQDNTQKLNDMYDDKKLTAEMVNDFFSSTREAIGMVNENLIRSTDIIKSFKRVAVDVSNENKREFNFVEHLAVTIGSIDSQYLRSGIKLSVQGDKSLVIEHYPSIVTQIVSSLVVNALQHAFSNQSEGEITISVSQIDNEIHLTVKDNGQGMPKDVESKIFEPFYTSQRETGGAGLGLSILYNLVTHTLGGSVNCNSELGVGSEFYIIFPLSTRQY